MKLIAKTILSLFALTVACITAPAAVSIAAGPIFNPVTGHNYFLVGANTWTLAQNAGLSLGGNLVTINDAAENAWLKASFLDPNPTINPWIGLHDQDHDNVWEWISGEPVGYLNWAPGEPNFSHERVSNIFPANHSDAGLWNNAPDVVAAGVLYGIVEVPEPSVLAVGMISCALLVTVRRRNK